MIVNNLDNVKLYLVYHYDKMLSLSVFANPKIGDSYKYIDDVEYIIVNIDKHIYVKTVEELRNEKLTSIIEKSKKNNDVK